MSLIYEPKGRAREYSPLALNIFRGCSHRCRYCYAKRLGQPDCVSERPKVWSELNAELMGGAPDKQVLLSFMGDPYCPEDSTRALTRAVVKTLAKFDVPTAILTKGGTRCLRDLDVFLAAGKRLKVGATLTMANDADSLAEEPGAALPGDRLAALRELHRAGVKTWASFEPVIDPAQSLEMLALALPHLDGLKLGRLNHDTRAKRIDWAAFGLKAIAMVRAAGCDLYVKDDLAAALPAGTCTQNERDADAHAIR